MLKARIMTAAVLIPLVLFAIFSATPVQAAMLIAVVIAGGFWEYSRLAGLTATLSRVMYLVSGVALCALMYFYQSFASIVFVMGVCFWLIVSNYVLVYPDKQWEWRSSFFRTLMGYYSLVPCFVALNYLFAQAHGSALILFLLCIVYGADTGAYFSGKAYGRHTLLPLVSPGKTWEGAAGAFLVTLFVGLVGWYFVLPTLSLIWVMLLCIACFVFSVLGDLTESMLKRIAKIKDSGGLLPGHGGVLDRIDSLSAAAPLFAFGLWLLQ